MRQTLAALNAVTAARDAVRPQSNLPLVLVASRKVSGACAEHPALSVNACVCLCVRVCVFVCVCVCWVHTTAPLYPLLCALLPHPLLFFWVQTDGAHAHFGGRRRAGG